MKLIKRDTDYAIRAICYMAKEDRRLVSADELVKKLKIPRPFMRKILQILNNKKMARSYKGKGGGFAIKDDCGKIRIIDLIEAFQGPVRLNECLFKKSLCPNLKRCILKERIGRIEAGLISELKKITIGDLVGKRG